MSASSSNQMKPELVRVLVDKEDITDHMRVLYGDDRNWNHRTIRYRDFVSENDLGKDLQVKWRRQNGRMDCVIIRIRDLDSVFHGDLFYPTSTSTSCISSE